MLGFLWCLVFLVSFHTNPFTASSMPALLFSVLKENVLFQILKESLIFFMDQVTTEIKSLFQWWTKIYFGNKITKVVFYIYLQLT